MQLIVNPNVKSVFENYPLKVKNQLTALRDLVLEVANKTEGVEQLEETLKWGEPSYLTKHGSTIRMDWKAKNPEQYALYFKCTSLLVPTFKTLYKEKFKFEGNRAIVFSLNEKIPQKEIMHCISLALRYHKLKHLPLLGAI
ncbi:MAG: DUF1801 domain-containing protein [Vicingaceae bacterium]